MKKTIVFSFAVMVFLTSAGLLSCSKIEPYEVRKAEMAKVVNRQTASRNFSIALSKAVCSHSEVREFLKNEALKCFDNDYDVFYPLVKNLPVAELGTFREIIITELGSEQSMREIEQWLPTLTIYVSDVTWFDSDGFCAKNWDTSDQRAAVTYKHDDGLCHELFSNGYYLGNIEPGTIPGGPVLIVKCNERLTATSVTKSGDTEYSFISDVFDASKNTIYTKANNRYTGKYTTSWIQGQDPQDNSDIISADYLNRLNPDIIGAYNLLGNESYALQNDYIYYGMTPDSPKGVLRNDVRSKIVRFKIAPRSFNALFDDTERGDCNFVDSFETDDNGKGYAAEPSVETIYSRLWTEGALEINVRIYKGSDSGKAALVTNFYYDVKAKDLFTIKSNSILKEQWGSTPFKWYITWKYTITSRNENTLVDKWYYPENTPDLPTWDLLDNSAYYIIVSEHDSGATTTKTYNTITKKANSYTTKLGVEGTIKGVAIKTEFGWTASDETTTNEEVKVSWTNGDDEMADCLISYGDKYIDRPASVSAYHVKSYETDRFTFTILPYRY